MHEPLIERLRAREKVGVTDRGNHWSVSVSAAENWRFELTIPRDVLEWFVEAWTPGAAKKAWSDWSDWFAIKGEPSREELELQYASDVEYFIARIRGATAFRCVTRPSFRILGIGIMRRHLLQGMSHGEWHDIEPGVLPAATGGAAA